MNVDNPWGAASPAKELKDVSSNRLSYQEPSLSPTFPPAKPVDLSEESDPSPWESGSGTTYPPSAANPFNAPRTSALRTLETPKKNSQVRLAPTPAGESRAETPLSSPGLDGPLTYSWQPKAEIVLGLAVVGPTVEWSHPPALTRALEKDEELNRLLPFLALPDGAHLSEEDYSYFHCVYAPIPNSTGTTDEIAEEDELPQNQTIFGISCNRQILAADLLVKGEDVTRSTVQKAVVVLASRPVFVSVSDKLGVVTRAFFAQRDFSSTELLPQFYNSIEVSLRDKGNESSMYIGTSLRELLHKFRHRTLTIVKLLMLQKRIMLYGYPVERLCTYQYSLISLMPGLLMNLADAGGPDLDFRSEKAKRPTSLRTSDRNSLLRYMGLPLHTFGANAFFQPYLPLQQIEMLTAGSWLVGTTNSIVTQQRDCQWDLLINIDQNTFEFQDKELEKLVSLTPSDRVWMDQVVKSVEETWNPSDPTRPMGMSGSDDDLRSKFEEYICSALSTMKYADYIVSGQTSIPMPGELPLNVSAPFSEKWLLALKETSACKTWYKSTDELLFDICEPRHPCEGKANAISDIGIRLTEGLYDLHIPDQLGPTKEAIGSALAAGSSSLFRAFDGVRSEVTNRLREREGQPSPDNPTPTSASPVASSLPDVRSTIGGIGSFFGSKLASWQQPKPVKPDPKFANLRPLSLSTTSGTTGTSNASKGSPSQVNAPK
ncbi:hypothetical protein FFLO_02990 [Filobasidium floriforme]|uniref:UDENN domain-containing protein n=1 Tax=Filobasidium floriforme TaxID=5210 RepID=A0A8K0NQP8_9TREE|nr:hypothetical protein FFLO_02990 [Filobasidium floriforme]